MTSPGNYVFIYPFTSWRSARVVGVIFSVVLLAASALMAQTPMASISGVVSDPSGAAVPAVKITVTDTARGMPAYTQTNQTGVYLIKNLIPSTYRITAEVSGFRKYVVDTFPLSANQDAILNISLQIGTATQTVEVTGQVQMVNPSNATLGGLMQNSQISDLPISNRNVLAFMALEPGVAPSTPNSYNSNGFTSAPRFSINGGLESTSDFELDGVSILNQSDLPGIYGLSVEASLDSIQELKVETNSYSTAYGRSGGGITTMVSKSGTNAWHGSAYEYLQNNVFNSTAFFTNKSHGKKSVVRYDQWGLSGGGPIIKNESFVFATYERILSHSGSTSYFTVPTALERQGNFTQTYNAAGAIPTVYNPFSTYPDPVVANQFDRLPFSPNNIIPTNLLDPVAAKIQTYYPAPNLAGTPIGTTGNYTDVNNLFLAGAVSNPTTMLDLRGDQNFGGNKRGFIRYDRLEIAGAAVNFWNNPAVVSNGSAPTDGHNGVLGYTQTFGSATVMDLRMAFDHFTYLRNTFSLGYDITQVGFPQYLVAYNALGNVPMFPGVTITNYTGTNDVDGPYYTSHNQEWTFSGNVARVIGRHTLTFGAQSNAYFLNFVQTNPINFSFPLTMTQGPVATTTGQGNAYAAFLMGTGTGGSASDTALTANANHYFAEFVQEDFKMTKRLTLNVGLRYEQETGTTERHNRLTAINPSVLNPISTQVGFNVYGGYEFAGSGSDNLGRRAIVPMEYKPNPRIGFAYLLNDKTTVRAGYGIFFGVTHTGATDGYTGSAFSTSTSWLPTLDSIHVNGSPQTLLNNPFPNGFIYPTGTSLGLLTSLGGGLSGGLPQSLRTEYNQQWNFTVQRNLTTNLMLQMAYAGGKGTHLGAFECCGATPNMDELPVSDWSQGNALTALVANPFYGIFPAAQYLGGKQIQKQYLERPWPNWNGVGSLNAAIGNSEYNALQMMLQKRWNNGTSFVMGYTWSKMMSDVVDGRWNDASYVYGAGVLQSWHNLLGGNHGVNSYDVPARFTFSGVGQLPIGKGHRFGSTMPTYLDYIVGGWQTNAIMTIASGMPIIPYVASNTTLIAGVGQRPNISACPALPSGSQTLGEWFNTSVFSQPANFTIGSGPKNITCVRNDLTNNIDFSLFKNFNVVHERVRVQLRAEAFNFLNHPIFSAPGSTFGSTSFGLVSGQSNGARVIQMAARLFF